MINDLNELLEERGANTLGTNKHKEKKNDGNTSVNKTQWQESKWSNK